MAVRRNKFKAPSSICRRIRQTAPSLMRCSKRSATVVKGTSWCLMSNCRCSSYGLAEKWVLFEPLNKLIHVNNEQDILHHGGTTGQQSQPRHAEDTSQAHGKPIRSDKVLCLGDVIQVNNEQDILHNGGTAVQQLQPRHTEDAPQTHGKLICPNKVLRLGKSQFLSGNFQPLFRKIAVLKEATIDSKQQAFRPGVHL
ncbi:hypothetical protein TYRP_016746 [Tyrophagus putrescentiae]|nr:hypothetical protein TYRP_016746 [Tyrophagus putrescentiae]